MFAMKAPDRIPSNVPAFPKVDAFVVMVNPSATLSFAKLV
jgi:hypothetical protein